MSQIITMQQSDGIGNQMFQYAAARALSQTLGGKIVLIQANSTTDYRPILFLKGQREAPLMKPTMIYRQADYDEAWSPENFKGTDNLLCIGHFQYLSAIQPVLPFVRDEFLNALNPICKQLIHKYNIAMRKRAAFIHIHREAILAQAYYERAIETLEISTKKSLHWYVVSDDIDWCRRQPWLQGKQLIDEKSDLTALAFMSLCEGGSVIANSTFSWWGAILAGAPTAYPSKWGSASKPQIFPSNWIQVPSG